MLRPLANNEYDWKPERSPSGPITIVVSAADKALYVYRNGEPIGRAPVVVSRRGALGDHAPSRPLDRHHPTGPARRPPAGPRKDDCDQRRRNVDADQIASRLHINPEFAAKAYDTIAPGTTVIITDQPVVRKRVNAAVLES